MSIEAIRINGRSSRRFAAVRKRLPREWESRICYQSRVGRLKWLEPSTEHEIAIAGGDKTGVIVSPIAFVSEHVETLVELDRDYAGLARQAGVPFYIRAPALSAADDFISSLADHVSDLLASRRAFIRKPALGFAHTARRCAQTKVLRHEHIRSRPRATYYRRARLRRRHADAAAVLCVPVRESAGW
ncbi:MAG: ferrochelatase [Alphaproteobacteria bacterium]